jgi:hypothetical protein
MKLLIAFTGFAAMACATFAQIQIVNSGATGSSINLSSAYSQNFDTLANTATNLNAWVDNSTLPGWYAYQNSSGGITSYRANGPYQLASLGGNGASDRALGSGLDSGVGDAVSFGVQFQNSTASLITSLLVSFDGEQWWRGSTPLGQTDSLNLSYQIFDPGQGAVSVFAGWTSVETLSFTSPITGFGTGPLDGNLAANRIANINATITGFSVAPGQELWIRWTATNLEGINDHTLAVDNLNVTFGSIPEPSTYSLVFAGLAATVAVFRRRIRK